MADAISRGRFAIGERHGMAKLTDAQASEIKSDPRLHSLIAEDYGISFQHVSAIKRGATRKSTKGAVT